MFKHIRNITAVFTAILMFAGGNFAYAMLHSNCIQVNEGYIYCEMECCKKNPCLEEFLNYEEVIIKDDSNICCKLHVEQRIEQDGTIPVIKNNTEFSKSALYSSVTENSSIENIGFSRLIHKLKTTNIYLKISNLRI